jgi:hypothetical protein
MKVIVFSPPYDETSGGIVVLHKLCSLINNMDGFESFMVPLFSDRVGDSSNLFKKYLSPVKSYINYKFKPYKTNPSFDTPVFKGDLSDLDDYLVIYPEITFGNPLKSKNTVRWLLHQPGFHTNDIYYGAGELYFKFNSAINDFFFPGSTLSQNELKVIHYPTELYNKKSIPSQRTGDCYAIRKGKGKELGTDLNNAVKIDGKSNVEVAAIFKKSKRFISYDTYTAYSIFAVLCGCESIVIPDEGVSKEEWYPNTTDRYGIAYGTDYKESKHAVDTAYLVERHVFDEEKKSISNIKVFLCEAKCFFHL